MVKPQATLSLWPSATPGSPGSPLPMTFQPGAFRWTRYRSDGRAMARCGSLASSGWPDAEELEFDGQAVAEVVDAGVDAAREGGGDPAGVGRVDGPLRAQVAAVLQQPGEAVGLQTSLPDHLGRLADAHAAPQVDLEEAVLGGDKALGEKQVFGILCVDGGDAPAVAQHLHRLLQARVLELALELAQDCA